MAISTSLIKSRSVAAVVHFPLPGFEAGGNIPFEAGGLDLCWWDAGIWRQKHGDMGLRGFENANSMIPCYSESIAVSFRGRVKQNLLLEKTHQNRISRAKKNEAHVLLPKGCCRWFSCNNKNQDAQQLFGSTWTTICKYVQEINALPTIQEHSKVFFFLDDL